MMKNRNFQEQEYRSKPMYQSTFISQFIPARTTNTVRDYSIDKNVRRSPAPQERYSHVPNQVIYQIPAYSANDYQMTPRVQDLYSSTDNSKLMQDLMMRIQKLQFKSQRLSMLEAKIGQIQANVGRLDLKIESLQSKKQDYYKGKENSCTSLQNKMNQEEFNSRNKSDFVLKDDLQKHLATLDSSFKTHLNTFKTVLNSQMSDYNIKNKKKFIEITATQLNQKLQQFRTNFSKQWETQLRQVVKQSWQKQYICKTVIGLSKQRFIGSAVALKVYEQLSIAVQGKIKQLQKIQTLYYLDKNGYLLDKNMYYLLDKNNNQIRLADQKLQMMRKEGILTTLNKETKFAKDKTLQTNNTA